MDARFYISFTLEVGKIYNLPRETSQHIFVRRIRLSEQIELFNGNGLRYQAELQTLDKKCVTVQVVSVKEEQTESPLTIILAQGVSSGERMDLTIQKSVELGVHQIIPITTRRSIVHLKGDRAEKRIGRWQDIVISACEQSGRDIVPQVEPIISFDTFLSNLPNADCYLLLSTKGVYGFKELLTKEKPASVCLLIGPEGGFEENEEEKAIRSGFFPILLGKRILRTETASLAVISALQTIWGDFCI